MCSRFVGTLGYVLVFAASIALGISLATDYWTVTKLADELGELVEVPLIRI